MVVRSFISGAATPQWDDQRAWHPGRGGRPAASSSLFPEALAVGGNTRAGGPGPIREDKDYVCRQPQVWAGNHWPADSGRPQNWCSCSTWPPLSPSSLPGVRDCHAVWVGIVGGAGLGILAGRGGWYSTLRDGTREACCRSRVTAVTNTPKANAPGHRFLKDSFRRLL